MYSSTTQKIEGGRPGLQAKVRQIRYLVERAKRDPNFRAKTVDLLAELGEKDHLAEIETLAEYTKAGIRYVRDPWSPDGMELFVDPRLLLKEVDEWEHRKRPHRPSGDCDDHVLLASALLETAGYPTRYVVGGLPPDHYRHIWLEVHSPTTGWLPIELTRKDAPVGWDPSERFPLVERYSGGGSSTMNGLGHLPPRVVALRRLRSSGRTIPPAYRPANALGGMSFDIPAPRSYHNSFQDTALYAGATPSDFFRATEMRAMLPDYHPLRHSPLLGLDHALGDYDDLAGFFKWYKKVIKKVTAPIVKTLKPALAPILGVAGTLIGGPALGVTAFRTVTSIQEAKESAKIQAQQIAAQESAAAAERVAKAQAMATAAATAQARLQEQAKVSSLPSSIYSTVPGPSFVQASQGFALPAGAPDQVAVMDQQPIPKRMGVATVGGINMGMVALAAVPILLLVFRGRR